MQGGSTKTALGKRQLIRHGFKLGDLLVPKILGLEALDQIMKSPGTKTEVTIDLSSSAGASFLTWLRLTGSFKSHHVVPSSAAY